MTTYHAPWSRSLKAASLLVTLFVLGFGIFLATYSGQGGAVLICHITGISLLALIPGCALLTVRGYSVTSDAILVRRLLWATRLPRAELQSATYLPGAMTRSIRLCGNSGLYSFTGWFWNRELRTYRAFVTDRQRTVVLRYRNRTIVLSPESPEEFVRALT